MTEQRSSTVTEKLLPCPFCAAAIKHVESWAKSFDPPRLYHEWHHPKNEDCYIYRLRSIVEAATDDPKSQADAVIRWNTRATAQIQPEPVSITRAWAVLDETGHPIARAIWPNEPGIAVKEMHAKHNIKVVPVDISTLPSTDRPSHDSKLEACRKALEPLARLNYLIDDTPNAPDTDMFFQHDGCTITYGDIRAAVKALAAGG